MLLTKLTKNNKGGAVIFFALMLTLLFSSILIIVLDTTHVMKVSRDLDLALDLATKAASAQLNWEEVYNGNFIIDVNNAPATFRDIFERNFLRRGQTGYVLTEPFQWQYEFIDPTTRNVLTIFIEVQNDPQPTGFILGDARHNAIIPPTNNPVVAAFGVVRYNRVGMWNTGPVYLRRVAVSQLTVN